jgi:dTDP-4-amino-4,6-dideoxygalactose transaminase
LIPTSDVAREQALLRDELLAAAARVIDAGDFILGSEVDRFERELARTLEVPEVVAVGSGTDALILAFRELGIGRGDEVITVANTFVATAASIVSVGAIPVFVDVGIDENMVPDGLRAAVSSRTKAIVPVHLRGRPADMTRICDFAEQRGILVIEDAAQAIGARHRGQLTGTFGRIACFSLHPLKVLGACGDGGFMTTADPELAHRLRILRNHGLQTRDLCVTWGLNSRLDTLQAALLRVKLPHLHSWIERRRAIAATYLAAFADLDVILPNHVDEDVHVYASFVVMVDKREAVRGHLRSAGVETRVHYPIPIHRQPGASGCVVPPAGLPVTERQANEILSLPMFPAMTDGEVQEVVAAFRDAVERRDQARAVP